MCINWDAISAIAAVAGTIAVLITVFEMKRQRFATYLPQILIKNRDFYIGATLKGRPIMWQGEYKGLSQEDKQIEQSTDISLQIVNVGLAAAVNVTIEFLYDLVNIEKMIDETISNRFEKRKTESGDSIIYLYEYSNEKSWPFILEKENPIKYSVFKIDETKEILLPKTIKNFINIMVADLYHKEDSFHKRVMLIPVKVKIAYNDISLNKVNREQKVWCNLQIMNSEKHNGDIRGSIEFLEKNRKIHLTIAST